MKTVKIISILVSSLFVGQIAFADENPFLKFKDVGYDTKASFFPNIPLKIAPKGNGSVTDVPEFPTFTMGRLGLSLVGLGLTPESRLEIVQKLARTKVPDILNKLDRLGLIQEAVRLGKIFKIDPVHVLGPIIGENTFNGFIDRTLQDTKHEIFIESDYEKMSARMGQIINRPGSQECLAAEGLSNFWKWRCIMWNNASGNNSNRDLLFGFYSRGKDSGTGTFGLGQIQPFILWSLNDLVAQKTGAKKFEVTDMKTAIDSLYNNKLVLAYSAASAYNAIFLYKYVASIDISANPGLTTTLYNLGDEYGRAYNLGYRKSQLNQKDAMPEVNYMGWFVNAVTPQINAYMNKYR